MDDKAVLSHYLRTQRAGLLAKVDGLTEYDIRRPMTSSGTNLLGLVKHVAGVQLGYLTDVFGRPAGRALPWLDEGADEDADMWVPAGQSRAEIVELHEFSAARSDATIEALPLTAPGVVPWWPPERRDVTLHLVLVHVCVETARHAGHADILRELIDGSTGMRPGDPNVVQRSADKQAAHLAALEASARDAEGREPAPKVF